MELKDLISLLKRSVRFLVFGLVVGAAFGFSIALIQRPVYEATTKILVSQTRQQSNAESVPLSIDQLVTTYLQLVKTQPVLDDASAQMGAKVKADNIQVAALPNTQIIQIRVQDLNPQRAAKIANTLFQILVQQNESLQAERYKSYEDALNSRINQVQKQIYDLQTQVNQINTTSIQEKLDQVDQQIEQLRAEITGLEQEVSISTTFLTDVQRASLAQKQAQLEQDRVSLTLYQQIKTNLTYLGNPGPGSKANDDPRFTSLQSTLTVYQQLNISLLNELESVRLAHMQNMPNVTQIDPALPPKEPIRPLPLLYVMFGSLVGLILSVTAILTIDHLDDSLRTAGQTEKLLGTAILGTVFDVQQPESSLIALSAPYSAGAEAFRALGASIDIVGSGKSIHTLMVVNAGPRDDKTKIAANLAIVNAQQGKKVILVDGDIRDPHLHHLFGIENQKGFAEIMDGELSIRNACHAVKDVEGMMLMPGGRTEKDSTEWLDAKRLGQLLTELQKQCDLVILESPSAEIADAQVFATRADAVLLAIYSGHTRLNSAQDTLRKFYIVSANIIGAVLTHKIYTRITVKNILPWAKIRLPRKGKDFYGDNQKTDNAPVSLT